MVSPNSELDAWTRLARSLEEKLKLREDDNHRLKRNLQKKQQNYEDLQEECNYKSAKIADLEERCQKESRRASQLSEILEASRPDAVKRKLLTKTEQYVESAHRVDTLELEVEKLKSKNEALSEERDSLSAKNAEAWSQLNKMKQERDKNNKLLLGLGDIVRTLHHLSVDYTDEEGREDDEEEATGRPHDKAVKNIKRKIAAFEKERQKLRQECKTLQNEISNKDSKISALEAFFHSVNVDRVESVESVESVEHPRDSGEGMKEEHSDKATRETTQQREPEHEVEVTKLTPCDQRKNDGELGSDRSESSDDLVESDRSESSDDSSFSTIDPPDVPMEKYESVQLEYESALQKILQLNEELSKTKASLKAMKNSTPESKEGCRDLEEEHEEALHEIAILENEVEEALTKYEEANSKNVALIDKYEIRLANKKNEYEDLHQKHEAIKIDYTEKLEGLQKEILEQEEFFHSQCEKLMQQNKEQSEAFARERKDFGREHSVAIDAQKKRFDELNFEYDTFMEIHNKLEDNLSILQEKYDQALKNIVKLEDEVKFAKKESLSLRLQKERLDEVLSERHPGQSDLNTAVERSRKAMLEAVFQYKKLKRDHEELVSKNGEVSKEFKQLQLEHKNLQNCCSNMEASGDEAVANYDRLKKSYESALSSRSEMERKIQKTEETSARQCYQLKQAYILALSKINEFGTRLVTARISLDNDEYGQQQISTVLESKASKPNNSFCDDIFHQDYHSILDNIQSMKSKSTSSDHEKDPIDEDDVWYDRLCHQGKILLVNEAVTQHFAKKSEPQNRSKEDTLQNAGWYDRLYHQVKLRSVHDSLVGAKKPSEEETVEEWYVRLYHHVKLRYVNDALIKAQHPPVERPLHDLLYERLLHQAKMRHVLKSLIEKNDAPSLAKDQSKNQPEYNIWSLCLEHQRKLRLVNEALTGILTISKTTTSPLSTQEDAEKTDFGLREEWCLFLLQMKRLQGVHIEIHNRAQHSSMSDRREGAGIETYDFLGHQRKLQSVHYDVLSRRDLTAATEPHSDFEGNSKMSHSGAPKKMNEQLPPTSLAIEEARAEIERLRDEVTGVKLVANAARIRYEAREKELRVVFFKFKKLLKQYNTAVTNTSCSDATDLSNRSCDANAIAGDDASRIDAGSLSISQADSYEEGSVSSAFSSQLSILLKSIREEKKSECDIKKLRKDLNTAKLKVEMMNVELHRTKGIAEEANKKLKEREQGLQDVISQYKALENENKEIKECLLVAEDELPKPAISRESSQDQEDESIPEIFRNTNIGFLGSNQRNTLNLEEANGMLDFVESFDGSQLTSVCGSHYTESSATASAEARDEKPEKTRTKWHEHEATIETISIIKMELAEAKRSAKREHEKKMQQEQHLRDVIFHYKKLKGDYDVLKGEYDALVAQTKETRGVENEATIQGRCMELEEERDSLKAKISTIQGELEAAKNDFDELMAEANAQNAKTEESRDGEMAERDDHQELRKEHDSLKAKMSTIEEELKDAKQKEDSMQSDNKKLQMEHEAIQARMATLENELEAAEARAEGAKKKQKVRDGHLRQVIDQYKKLESEHRIAVAKYEKAKKSLNSKPEEKATRNNGNSLEEKRDISVVFDAAKVREERRLMLAHKVQALIHNQIDNQSDTSQKSKFIPKKKGFFRMGRGHREVNAANSAWHGG